MKGAPSRATAPRASSSRNEGSLSSAADRERARGDIFGGLPAPVRPEFIRDWLLPMPGFFTYIHAVFSVSVRTV